MGKNTILLGDVLEMLKTLPSDSVDLGITSPPYNKQGQGGPIVKSVVYDEFDDILPEDEYQKQQVEVLDELWRIIKPGGSFFYNHRCRWENGIMMHPMEWLLKTKWNVKQEIIWNRKITGNLRGWRFWQIDERIYWLYKPDKSKVGKELKSIHARMSSIWDIMPENNNPHPAPFPLEIPARIIYSIFDDSKEKLVIDPYMGSGTVAVVAKLFGCDYLGIDISKTYIDMANKRISEYENYREIYNKEIEKHVITGKTYQERKAEKNNKKNLL
jgi:site-specific DNA-methyltransferase (adenine-specific)